LRQVLINLLGNALKFTERGEVSLNVAAEGIDALPATLRFTVRDTGIGISVETQQNLFKRSRKPTVRRRASTAARDSASPFPNKSSN
jgi:signal transduction histidine kinase